MPNYRRAWLAGGCFFFTLALRNRKSDLLVRHIDLLRASVARVRSKHPFRIHAWVVLPEHLHAILELPDGDLAFDRRWRLIKAYFTAALPNTERRGFSRVSRGERAVWQPRYWEHQIRDDEDFARHMDYVHRNPVKHGLVADPRDWEFSTFHRHVGGTYQRDWLRDGSVL